MHICKKCASMPKEKRLFVEAQAHVYTFLSQTHISDRNVSKLRQLAASKNLQVAQLANPMLETVLAAPRKRQRVILTMRMRDEISVRWAEAGILPDDEFEEI